MCNCNTNIIDDIDQEIKKAIHSLNNAYAAEGGLSTKKNVEAFFKGKIAALTAVKTKLIAKKKSKNKNKKYLKPLMP